MANFDAAHRQELRDALVYELYAIAVYRCRVDFDFIARVWQEYEARVPNMVVAGIVNVRTQGASFAWQFSRGELLTGIVDLTEGAPEHDRFVVHE